MSDAQWLVDTFRKIPVISSIVQNLKQTRYVVAGSAHSNIQALAAASLAMEFPDQLIVVTGDDEQLTEMEEDLTALGGTFVSPRTAGHHFISHFLRGLHFKQAGIYIVGQETLSELVISNTRFEKNCSTVKSGAEFSVDRGRSVFTACGYESIDCVEHEGQFSIRGCVLDFWLPGDASPVRVVLSGNTVEEIYSFSPETQRRASRLNEVTIFPIMVMSGQGVQLRQYLGNAGLVMWFGMEEPDDNWISSVDSPALAVYLAQLPIHVDIKFNCAGQQVYHGKIDELSKQVTAWLNSGWTVAMLADNVREIERLKAVLSSRGIMLADTRIKFLVCSLKRGIILRDANLSIVTDGDVFGRYRIRPRYIRLPSASPLKVLATLKPMDFVVHERYGIARFCGLTKMEVDNKQADYLDLEYAGGDRLYVPVEDFDKVQKYIAPEGVIPKIYPLGSASWERTKAHVRKSVEKIAHELVDLYAWRMKMPGFAFPQSTEEEYAFESEFPFEETPDQLCAIAEVKKDMENPRPMDRIVCGDVGYGKTEVAMRAALKCVLAGKQVAVLAPTTVLCEQHWRTFSQRFDKYPVVIEMLSRFKSRAQSKRILEEVKVGSCDILIGTHRLFGRDVQFNNLGLVVIDEEHRFGVKHKEALKRLRRSVDVLTLTATPIPRTLSMSLGGLRDSSRIETPPIGRLSVETYVGPYNIEFVERAMRYELNRGGQVYYVHNRIETIDACYGRLRNIVQHARIAVAHGRMPARQLEQVMLGFIERQYDVLLSTSIVESGLDIPNVNTMIIEDADRFGLAQLYQLRGRVGREQCKAYCYMFYSRDRILTDDARRRLESIAEFTELGSGLTLALRDLEIRGAGNLLGTQQHGRMMDVGFDMYMKILDGAVRELRREPVVESVQPQINLQIDAYIPVEYVESDGQRLTLYRRLLAAKEDEVSHIAEEIADRWGQMPQAMQNLIQIIRLRNRAVKLGVTRITQKDDGYVIALGSRWSVKSSGLKMLVSNFGKQLSFSSGDGLSIVWKPDKNSSIKDLDRFLQLLKENDIVGI